MPKYVITHVKTYDIEADDNEAADAVASDIIDCLPPDTEHVSVQQYVGR